MSAAAKKTAGTTVWIGTTASNGGSDTYTEIKHARQIGGSIGGAWNMADSTATSDTVKMTTKTVFDPGDMDLDINEIPDDAGQLALKAAFDDVSDESYNFELRYLQGDKERFKGKVAQWSKQPGGATSLRTVKSKVMLTSAVTHVAAA